MERTRRAMFGYAGAALVGASSLTLRSAGAAAQTPGTAPPDVGRKFLPDGRVKTFRGNTIICHLQQQDAGFDTFNALLAIYRDLPGHSFAGKLAILPPSSYHMTIFGGANDLERKPGLWPADLALDLPMATCNAVLAERLMTFNLDCELPIRMRVDLAPAHKSNPVTLDLTPVDDGEMRKLRRLRDRLSDLLKIRAPGHDDYAFHMTIAYQIAWFDEPEQAAYTAAHQDWLADVQREAPVISFGAPEYCTFDDMFAFRRRLLLT